MTVCQQPKHQCFCQPAGLFQQPVSWYKYCQLATCQFCQLVKLRKWFFKEINVFVLYKWAAPWQNQAYHILYQTAQNEVKLYQNGYQNVFRIICRKPLFIYTILKLILSISLFLYILPKFMTFWPLIGAHIKLEVRQFRAIFDKFISIFLFIHSRNKSFSSK